MPASDVLAALTFLDEARATLHIRSATSPGPPAPARRPGRRSPTTSHPSRCSAKSRYIRLQRDAACYHGDRYPRAPARRARPRPGYRRLVPGERAAAARGGLGPVHLQRHLARPRRRHQHGDADLLAGPPRRPGPRRHAARPAHGPVRRHPRWRGGVPSPYRPWPPTLCPPCGPELPAGVRGPPRRGPGRPCRATRECLVQEMLALSDAHHLPPSALHQFAVQLAAYVQEAAAEPARRRRPCPTRSRAGPSRPPCAPAPPSIAAADEATAPYGDGCPGAAVGDVRHRHCPVSPRRVGRTDPPLRRRTPRPEAAGPSAVRCPASV
ncbi:hypothetical protein SUDANB25_05792 [Streptomyces sp. SudanB25_2051]